MRKSFFAVLFSILIMASAAYAQPYPAGNTQASLEANKKLVLDFWRVVFDAQNVAAAKDFLSEGYIQHNPTVATGLKGFTDAFSKFWKEPKKVEDKLRDPPVLVIAEGDLVQLVFKRPKPEPADAGKTYDSFWFDTFRVKDGKIVEHWDGALKSAAPPAPQPGTTPGPLPVK